MRTLRFTLLALLVTAVASAQPAAPPTPTRFVTDDAGLLTPSTRASLDARLAAYERASHHQVLVWVAQSTGGEPLEPWCTRAFESWRVGRRGIDDGLVLFVFVRDRRVRIEVGYGLESVATDAQTARILREAVIPRLQAGDRDGAVAQGVDRVLSLLGGDSPKPSAALRSPMATLAQRVAVGLLALLFVVMMIRHPRLAWLLLLSLRQGGRGGEGGGGFSGGGGRSGGGGSSGSW